MNFLVAGGRQHRECIIPQVFYSGINIFNALPTTIKGISSNPQKI